MDGFYYRPFHKWLTGKSTVLKLIFINVHKRILEQLFPIKFIW